MKLLKIIFGFGLLIILNGCFAHGDAGTGDWFGTIGPGQWKTPTAMGNDKFLIEGYRTADAIKGATQHCAAKGKPTEIYNLASGRETTIAELAKIINEETNNPTPPKLFPAREWDRSGKRFGSTIKAKNEIGFEAEVDIRTGISQLVNWTKENRSLIESCIKKHDRLIQNLSK